MLRYLLILAISFNAFTVRADFQFKPEPGCILHKNDGKSWLAAPLDELNGQTFPVKPFGKFGVQWSMKVNGSWFYADKSCFEDLDPQGTSTPSPTPIPIASPGPSATPAKTSSPAQKAKPRVLSRPVKRKWGIDFAGTYWMLMSDTAKAETSTIGSFGKTMNAMGAMIGAKARLTYLLSFSQELALNLGYSMGTKSGVLTGLGTTSESTVTDSFTSIDFGLGYRYLFGSSSFRPYMGLDLGYAMVGKKESILLTGSTGATYSFSGSGLMMGGTLGSYYYFSEGFRMLLGINYSLLSTSQKVSESTDTATLAAGADGGKVSLSHLGIELGIGFCF